MLCSPETFLSWKDGNIGLVLSNRILCLLTAETFIWLLVTQSSTLRIILQYKICLFLFLRSYESGSFVTQGMSYVLSSILKKHWVNVQKIRKFPSKLRKNFVSNFLKQFLYWSFKLKYGLYQFLIYQILYPILFVRLLQAKPCVLSTVTSQDRQSCNKYDKKIVSYFKRWTRVKLNKIPSVEKPW